MSDVCLCDFEESYFYNSMVCKSHTERLKLVHAKYPTRGFYLFTWEELDQWFHCLCNENKAICSFCDKLDCYTCNRFRYIKNEIHKVGYFVARDSWWQPITWELHEIHLSYQPFKLYFKIDRTIRSNKKI